MKIQGVTYYRLRHTFKTLGKKARDHDALDLCMGHRDGATGEVHDHEEIEFSRIKRVAKVVYRQPWPKPKERKGNGKRSGNAGQEVSSHAMRGGQS